MALRLPWPLPALLTWLLAWLLFQGVVRFGANAGLAGAVAVASSGVLALTLERARWRRISMIAGVPLLLGLTHGVSVPGWIWLLALLVALTFYPRSAWRDAPLFPTPLHALQELPLHVLLDSGARVLDAGCGTGAGLRALRLAYPAAQLEGIESSWPLRWLCRLRCPWARVRQGDFWRHPWDPYAMVYLFQRPETMSPAWIKAQTEMAPGSWLVSLEFEIPQQAAVHRLGCSDGRVLWVYRVMTPAPATGMG